MEGKRIGHYEVLEKIGEGGMGVVYRALDTRLGRDVALKFLSVDFTGSEELKERFIQEAQAASQLDHQNICTIHAIEETDDGRLFIAMGYYEGETIKAKLRRGPLDWQDVVEIAVQTAAGLQAAHARGIIHLDVKPANLMVTHDGTVKILDFGLSRFTSEIDRTRPQGPLMGTVAYMAPEQVQGESTGPETDIWALGVVMYEMATGERPFQGKNDMAVLYSIVHRECTAPKESVPELPAELDQVIRRALTKDRQRRYSDTKELLADLEPLQQSTGTITIPPPPPWKRFLLLIAAVGVLGLLGYIVWRYIINPPDDSSNERPVTPALLFTGLRPASPADTADWRTEALGELLVTELHRAALPWIRLDDAGFATTLNGLNLEGGFNPERGLSDATLLELRKRGVEWTVGGTFDFVANDGGEILEVRLWVQAPGRPITTLTRRGPPTELMALAAGLAGELAPILNLESPEGAKHTGWPADETAAKLLARAREKLLVYEALAAQELLEKALSKELGNALLHIYLADALWQLGREESAREAAKNAILRAPELAPTPRIYVGALDLETRNLDQRAIYLLRVLWNEGALDSGPVGFPEVGTHLIRLLGRSRQFDVADEVLESLRAILPDHPLIAMLEGSVARSRPEAQQAFARAAELAREVSMPLLEAQALLQEGQQWERQGVVDKAEASLNAAREIFSREGYELGEAHALFVLGNLQWVQDLLKARVLWDEARKLYEDLGNERYQARLDGNQGRRLVDQGDYLAGIEALRRARQHYESRFVDHAATDITLANLGEALIVTGQFDEASKALENALTVSGDAELVPRQEATARTYLGWLSALRGDLPAADQNLTRAIDLVKDLGDEASVAAAHYYRSIVLRLRGEPEAAAAACQEALRLAEATEDSTTYARALTALGEIHMTRGDLVAADKAFREALDTLDKLPNPLWAAQTRISLASLLIERGQPHDAERQARVAVGEISQRSTALDLSAAYVVLARSLLAQGDAVAANEAVESARQRLGAIQSPLYQIPLEITGARISAALGHPAESVKKLDRLLGAESWRLPIELEMEILFAMGEIELQSGQGRRSRRLETVAQLAAQKGFELIRRKAEQANSSN